MRPTSFARIVKDPPRKDAKNWKQRISPSQQGQSFARQRLGAIRRAVRERGDDRGVLRERVRLQQIVDIEIRAPQPIVALRAVLQEVKSVQAGSVERQVILSGAALERRLR